MDILTDSHHDTRLEVVDTGRRRRWSEEAKLRIVEESFSGSRQASATARRHGISRAQLFSWRKAFREGRLGGDGGLRPVLPPAMNGQAPSDGARSVGFAPALVVPDAGPGVERAKGGPIAKAIASCICAHSRAGRMEVVTANGRRAIAGSDVDAAALIRVVQGIEGLR